MREATMRLTLTLLGLELDLTLGRQTPDTDDDVWVDCGATGSTPVGFTRSPHPEWDAPGSYHQFDPDDDSEDS
jgi:hypothetical protein